jgi:hypothetical protein
MFKGSDEKDACEECRILHTKFPLPLAPHARYFRYTLIMLPLEWNTMASESMDRGRTIGGPKPRIVHLTEASSRLPLALAALAALETAWFAPLGREILRVPQCNTQ